MSEEKKIDFCELRNLLYEITDLNESAIAVLEKVNGMESNKVITVLKCNEENRNFCLAANLLLQKNTLRLQMYLKRMAWKVL